VPSGPPGFGVFDNTESSGAPTLEGGPSTRPSSHVHAQRPKVQAILTERDQSGERQRTNQHYLKGTVFCARCQRRLGFLVATGRNGGKYDYFFCYGRQSKNGCDLPFLAPTKSKRP
jgi:hypothetical protein